MAVLDSIVVDSKFDPAGFQAGLAAATAEFQSFLRRTATLSGPVVAELKLNGVAKAVADVEQVKGVLQSIATPPPIDVKLNGTRDLAILAGQLQQVPEQAALGARATKQLTAAFNEAGGAAAQAAADAQIFARGLAAIGAQPLTNTTTQVTALQAALQQISAASATVRAETAAPITLPTGPSITSLENLQRTIGATVRQVETARQLLNAPLAISPAGGGAIGPIAPPDFSQTIAEATRAAAIMRAEFLSAFPTAALGIEAKQAATAAATALETGLLTRLGDLHTFLAAGIFPSQADAVRMADLAIDAMAAELRKREAELPALILRVHTGQPNESALPGINQATAFAGLGGLGADKVNSTAFRSILADLNALDSALLRGAISAKAQEAAVAGLRARYAELQSGVAPTVQSVGGLNDVADKSTNIFGGAARANLTLRSSLVVLASQATNTSTTFGRLLESVLLFGGGTAAVVAVAAPLLAIAVLYEQLTKNAREATKATDEFIKSQDAAFRSRDVVGSFREAFAGVDEYGRHVEGLTARMARLNQELDQVSRPRTIGGGKGPAVVLPADPAEIDKVNQRLTNAGTASLQTILGLVDPILSAVHSAADQATKDQLAITQQGIALRLDAVKAGFAAELITRDEFFRQSRDLATKAERADVSALQEELASAAKARAHAESSGPGAVADVIQLKALEAHLQAEIGLRQGLLTLTRQQTDELERQQKLALLDKAGIGGAAGISAVQPPVLADQKIALKPRIDLSEVEAQVAKFVTETAKIDLDNRFEDARLNGIALAAVLNTINLRLKDIGNANVNTRPILTLNESIHEVTRGLGDIAAASQNVGLIGTEAANAIGDVLRLGDAIGNVIASASTGNILGLIGAGIGVAGLIFGKGPGEAERDHILQQNNDRLRELTAAIDRGIHGIAPLNRAGQAAAILAPQGAALQTQSVLDQINNTHFAFDDLNRQLAAFGLTFDQLNAIAKQNGIQLLDSQGRIVAGSFQKLADVMGVTIEQMTRFGQSFQEQLDFFDLKARINAPAGGGPSSPTSQFQRDLDAAGAAGSSFVQHFFDGSLKDKATFQKRLNEFTDLFGPNSDFFKQHPELLGGLTPEDWKKILNDGASAMDLFNQATINATKQLQDFNIPTGFKTAALAFAAADPGGPTLPSGPPLRNDPTFAPPIPGDRHGASASSRSTAVTVQPGAIVIQQTPGESMTELAERVVNALRAKAMTQSGDTLHYWGLN